MSRLLTAGILQQQSNLKRQPIIKDGLISYYSFDDTPNDQYGSNDGIIVGNVTPTTGISGGANKAYNFPKNESSYIDLNNFSGFNFTKGSICFWGKNLMRNTDDQIGGAAVVEFAVNSGDFIGIRDATPGNLVFRYKVDGTTYEMNTQMPYGSYNGIWNHCVVTWGNGEIEVYFNSDFVFSVNIPSYITESLLYSYIMAKAQFNSTNIQMAGDLDEMLIYNRVLSDVEVKEIYNNY